MVNRDVAAAERAELSALRDEAARRQQELGATVQALAGRLNGEGLRDWAGQAARQAVRRGVAAAMLIAGLESWRRKRRGKPAVQQAERNGLELAYLAVLTAVVGFLVFVSFSANASFWSAPRSALTVRVTAFQWCWRFWYAGQ